MIPQQGFANRLSDDLPHRPFVMKLHFTLGGMNVDIHITRIDFQKKAANRVSPFHQRGVIPFEESVVEATVVYGAAVHEQMLVFPSGSRDPWLADESPYSQFGALAPGHTFMARLGRLKLRVCKLGCMVNRE